MVIARVTACRSARRPGDGAQHAALEGMRFVKLLPTLASVMAIGPSLSPLSVQAQQSQATRVAVSRSRLVVSLEISAAPVTRRAPADWLDAVPSPLLDRMAADEHFASIDLGGPAGNGILIRFDFDDMEAYRAWNDLPDVQQMLAEIGQVIGYGYSRTGISMRRVAGDPRQTPATRQRSTPNAPLPLPPSPKAETRMATRTP